MELPNTNSVIIPQAKITRYLLDLTSKDGRGKAIFFLGFGFTLEKWEVLADALKQHAINHEVIEIEETEHGKKYIVDGTLHSPDGRNPSVRVVWQIDAGGIIPRLVTARPLKK